MVLLHRGRVRRRGLHGGLHVLLVLLVSRQMVLGHMGTLLPMRMHWHLQGGGRVVRGHPLGRAGARARQAVGVVVPRAHLLRGILGPKPTAHTHVFSGPGSTSGGEGKVPVDIVRREVLQAIHLALLVLILGVLHYQAALSALQLATIQAQCVVGLRFVVKLDKSHSFVGSGVSVLENAAFDDVAELLKKMNDVDFCVILG
mmetsp:Transcript_43473/g.75577  ORF Transcript_43473/g.75577 Transcript_43473/m.75577 type:complete len:201 (-) Transcript_43473:512-1114(-)